MSRLAMSITLDTPGGAGLLRRGPSNSMSLYPRGAATRCHHPLDHCSPPPFPSPPGLPPRYRRAAATPVMCSRQQPLRPPKKRKVRPVPQRTSCWRCGAIFSAIGGDRRPRRREVKVGRLGEEGGVCRCVCCVPQSRQPVCPRLPRKSADKCFTDNAVVAAKMKRCWPDCVRCAASGGQPERHSGDSLGQRQRGR